MGTVEEARAEASATGSSEKRDALSVVDRRTGKSYELPIVNGTVRAMDFRQMKDGPDDFGLMTYDPAYLNTASCKSRITYIDGDKGILRYRGYPIEVLAEKCTFLEVAYLLLYGELPTQGRVREVGPRHHVPHDDPRVPEEAHGRVQPRRAPDGHADRDGGGDVDVLPEARDVHDAPGRTKQIHRLIAKMPTIAAFAYKHSMGMPYVYPSNALDYGENFLTMLFKTPAENYKPNPTLVRALDVLFILHADHEQNCGTAVMRGIGSAHTDPYSALAGAAAALYGPLHGGANEEVLRMLKEIGSVSRVPAFIEEVKQGKGEKRLMGFGHRVYKNFDPRAKIIKRMAEEVFDVTGRNPLLDIALELERIALQDDYFVKRKLYPNVDFYSGLIYQAIGIPSDAFTVLFAIPRTAGWLAQWEELLEDPEEKIARPRQVYLGEGERAFTPMEKR